MPRVPEHWFVTRAPGQLTVRQQPSISLSDSAIVIRMQAAGVCGTDLAMLSGARPCRAEVLGHEGVGVVVSAPESSGLATGARVIINPVHRKRPDHVIGHSTDGVFRELFWLDSAEAAQGGLLVECSNDAISSVDLALTEPLASVLYSLELIREKKNATSLLIRGSGTIAILAARVWATVEGNRAVLVSKSRAHAEWLRQAIRWPENVEVASIDEKCDVTGSAKFDSAILCCSREDAPEGLHFLMDAVQDGATIHLMAGFPAAYGEPRLGGVELDRIRWNNICGVQSAPATTVVDQVTRKTFHLTGHRGTAERHILQAVEMFSCGIISLADLPHRQITLGELPSAISNMLSAARHDAKWIKAIVVFPEETSGEPNGRA